MALIPVPEMDEKRAKKLLEGMVRIINGLTNRDIHIVD